MARHNKLLILATVLLVALSSFAGTWIASPGKGSHAAAGAVLVSENMEGTGLPAGWTVTGTVNWDLTTPVLQGSHCAGTTTTGSNGGRTTFASQATPVEMYFIVRLVDATPSTQQTLAQVSDSGDTLGVAINLQASGNIKIRDRGPGIDGTGTALVLSDNTNYHFWVRVVKGTGANAYYSVGYSTTGIRPSAGTGFTETTTGQLTANITQIYIGKTGTQSSGVYWDRVIVSSAVIGDNP